MAERKRASIEISFGDVEGRPVEPLFDLGANYTIVVGVTNRTMTRGDHPWEAELEVGVGISLDGIDILPYTIYPPVVFEPGQLRNYTSKVYIHKEYAGLSGRVTAKVFDAFGGMLASAQKRFKVSYEWSEEAIYKVSTGIMKGMDLPVLSPDLDMSEGQVVMGGASSRPLAPPPAQSKPKSIYNPSDKRVPLGLDCSSEPEPPVQWEGEVYTGNRIG